MTGDLETVLTVPFDDDDRFLLGVSDGTLLLGTYDDRLRCAWEVTREGTGGVRFEGDRVSLDSSVAWVTASLYDANLVEPPPREATQFHRLREFRHARAIESLFSLQN